MGHGGGRVHHSLWPQGVENSSSLAEGGGGVGVIRGFQITASQQVD